MRQSVLWFLCYLVGYSRQFQKDKIKKIAETDVNKHSLSGKIVFFY